jgi:hypothetical protein
MIDFNKEVIGFQLANNTNSAYNINITNGGGFPPKYSVNATTKYEWLIDINDWDSSVGLITVNGSYELIYYTPYDGTNKQESVNSIIDSLNSLNFGFFTYNYSGLFGVNIMVYDNTNTYGSLSDSD